MLTRGALYALQATLHLAQQKESTTVSAATMADRLDVPPEYLAKVLARLKDAGILASARGARGGYRLSRPPARLSVEVVVQPFEQPGPLKRCLLGGRCDPENPCSAHLRRLEWREARSRILAATSLTDLLPDGAANARTARDPEPHELNDRT